MRRSLGGLFIFLLVFVLALIRQFVFFFFQAEDVIRGFHGTGVQTCALPISPRRRRAEQGRQVRRSLDREHHGGGGERSEERRVGKERRSPRTRRTSTKQ